MSKFYTHVINRRNKILVCGHDDKKRFKEVVDYQPYMFVPATKDSQTKYKDIYGKPVDKKRFRNSGEMRNFKNNFADIEGFKLYGIEFPHYLYIYEKYNKQVYDASQIVVCYIDIETDSKDGYPDLETADREINTISMVYNDIKFSFGLKDFIPKEKSTKYFKCKNEVELFTKFLKVWTSERYRPDVVSGWNIEFFDIPYIAMRLIRVLGEDYAKMLSPWGILESKNVFSFGKQQKVFFPIGVSVLDYMHLYKKFVGVTKPQESYRLDHIANVELEERKIDYSEYGSLNGLYEQNPQLFVEYNIQDCVLVKRLNDKLKLIELIYKIAYDCGVNYTDALGTVRAWDIAIHNYLMDRDVVVSQSKMVKSHTPVGGYVKKPLTGMFNWVVSFDLRSLYPHLIMQYNIGPDTFKKMLDKEYSTEELIECEHKDYWDYLDKNDLSMAANSALFSKNKISFLSELMKTLFNERKTIKTKMLDLKSQKESGTKNLEDEIKRLDTHQYALKVRLNSAYGALCNIFFRWYDIRYAEAITKSGQLTIKLAEKRLNEFLNNWMGTITKDYIISMDTDSLLINMEPIVKELVKQNFSSEIPPTKDQITKVIDFFCRHEVQPFLDKIFKDLAENMRAYEQAMYMKREVIADVGVFIAKKRYMLNVLNNEGVQYDKPNLKIMGLESVRSSTPSACRTAIEESIRIILQEGESALQDYIEDFRKKFQTLPFVEIARNSSVNGIEKYSSPEIIYGKGCPIHVRGALLFNMLLKQHKMEKVIDPIFEGSKIKFCYLKIPNPISENVISVANVLPKEFELEQYLDRQLQFEKTFLEPVNHILKVINWTSEPINSVADFFK